MLHPSIKKALADERLLAKKARSAGGADINLLRREYELLVLIENAKQKRNTDTVKSLTEKLIEVQKRQPKLGAKFR